MPIRTFRTCILALVLGVALMTPTAATTQPAAANATQAAPVAKRGGWEKTFPQMGVRSRYWWNNDRLQERWVFHFKRRPGSKGKRQVRVRWRFTKGAWDSKANRWKKRTRRIAPGGHRRIKFRLGRCGPKTGLSLDVQVRRNRLHKPKKWRKWKYLVAIYSDRDCR